MTNYLNPSTRNGGVEQIVVPERQGDNIDGKVITGNIIEGAEITGSILTGGIIRNAASGPRVVISENTVTGVPGAVEWHDDLNPGVGDTLDSPPNIRGSAVDYPGGAQRYRLFLTSGRVDEPGQAALYLDSDRSDAVERNVATLTAKTITLSGDVTSTKPVVIQDRTWTTVPPEMLAAPFVGTVKYRYTHDNILIVKVAVSSNGVAVGVNPYITAIDALPRPVENLFWFFRVGNADGSNEVSNAFYLTDGRLRLVKNTGGTYSSVSSTIIAPMD